eukprot:CAMPEP_0180553292 /NCGR_PEP_ID=MMETSP1036_2-20121128/74232_1 /TAXON_ID=632150 /ORGANISM="Azadinium spinosum, Strain 3D9" /LENGTH=71 /DNA_ID=CAMNT_0022568865 /DNA_START=13 /DNA_END=225 /DNA_ORIENTATION=-
MTPQPTALMLFQRFENQAGPKEADEHDDAEQTVKANEELVGPPIAGGCFLIICLENVPERTSAQFLGGGRR